MRNFPRSRDGFTLTELSVLVAVGGVLAAVLAADLTQARVKLLQQACAANMKQWGMAFDMYAQDYNGTFYYDVGGTHFSDLTSPLVRYFGSSSNTIATLVAVRTCPARIGQAPSFGGWKGYEIPVGQYHKGLTYKDADVSGSSYFRGGNYWPDLKSVPQPAQYLLMIETYNTLHCSGLANAVFLPAVSSGNVDPLPSIARHGGAVNCLFGDFHVELVSSNSIVQHAAGCGSTTGNPWFSLN